MPKLVIMPSNFLIAYSAMPFFRQLIHRQGCTVIRQHSSIIFLQMRICEYCASGNIFFRHHWSLFPICIFQSSIDSTQRVKITIWDYWIFHNYIANPFFLGAMSISYSQLCKISWITNQQKNSLFSLSKSYYSYYSY